MHNIVLSPVLAGENHSFPMETTQCDVFKTINASLQSWAEAKIPFGKDGYRNIADLLTKLPT
ncbi:MAG: hypothetical protein AAB133_08830, partial [Pseudomonadota bacterium]